MSRKPESEVHRTSWVRMRRPAPHETEFDYAGRCTCSWKGALRETVREAASDCADHLEQEGC